MTTLEWILIISLVVILGICLLLFKLIGDALDCFVPKFKK